MSYNYTAMTDQELTDLERKCLDDMGKIGNAPMGSDASAKKAELLRISSECSLERAKRRALNRNK